MTNKEQAYYLYKYRAIDENNLDKDFALYALFNSFAVFSSRRIFNDPFDSKIIYPKPSPLELKILIEHFIDKAKTIRHSKLSIRKLNDYVHKGKITPHGIKYIQGVILSLNNLTDEFRIFSLSSSCNNILLWSHYANMHRGFCIQYKPIHINAEKVDYKDDVPKIKLIEILPLVDGDDNIETGRKIKNALLTKHIDWKYENEFRMILSDEVKATRIDEFRVKIPYEPDYIESIIFGSRMPEKIKKHIINNMPYETTFKQAHELEYSIEIRPYSP